MAANTSVQIPTDGSPVWHFFAQPVLKDGKRKAKCYLCTEKKTYLIISKGSTSSLCSHITNIHHINIAEAVSYRNFPVVSQSGDNVLRQALVKWITTDSLPFTAIESESFQELADIIRNLENNITISSASTVKWDLLGRYLELKAILKNTLINNTSKISLTTDMWTSNSCKAFIGVMAHWINENWKVKSQVLNLAPFDKAHTGINIANTLFSICIDFSINNKILEIAINNASSNNTLLETFES